MKNLVILPCYNEEENVKSMVQNIKNNTDSDILIINDVSTDKTPQIAKILAKNHKNVKVGKDTVVLGSAMLCGGCVVGDRCLIGANATILHKVVVGNDVIIAAGSVVTKDVPDGEIWAGNPAKKIGDV